MIDYRAVLTRLRPLRRNVFGFLVCLALLASLGATVVDLNEAGKAAYARSDYAAAERLFDQAIVQAPKEPLLHYHRAVALTRLGRWRDASEAYETVLRLNPPQALRTAARDGLRALDPLTRARSQPAHTAGVRIPLRRTSGVWLTEVVLNETKAGRFLVDTGATYCAISPELATELGVDPGSRAPLVELQAASGQITGRLTTIPLVRVGEVEAKDVRAVIHEIGPGMDGILGNSFLGRFIVTLDPKNGHLYLRGR
jgi:aspartyl protease family protein